MTAYFCGLHDAGVLGASCDCPCPCGCPTDCHIGEIGCPCALPGEGACAR